MNKEYANFGVDYSNNGTTGIYEAFYAEVKKPHQGVLCGLWVRLVGAVRSMISVLTAVRVRRRIRVGCATLSMLGTVGVAGSLETGKLSPIACLFLAAGFLFLTYLALKPKRSKKAISKQIRTDVSIIRSGNDQFCKRFSETDSGVDSFRNRVSGGTDFHQ